MEPWSDEWDEESPDRDSDRWLDDDVDLSLLEFEDLYSPEVLAAIEAAGETDSEPVSRLGRWSRTTAIGAVLTGMALGLQEVFDPEEERSIVIEVDDDGLPLDLPVQLFLDPDSPSGSLCIIHRNNVPPPLV